MNLFVKKMYILTAVISLVFIMGCSDSSNDEALEKDTQVEQHIDDKSNYESTIDITDDKQAEQIKSILNDIKWENLQVEMVSPPHYNFKLVTETEVVSYNLWISPNKNKIEITIPYKGKYAQADEKTSAELFELLTGNKLSDL